MATTTTVTPAAAAITIFPEPPRLTGNYDNDYAALSEWLFDFFARSFQQNGLAQTSSLGSLATMNSVGTAQVADGAITYPKIQPVGPNTVLGNAGAAAGTVVEIACTGAGRTLLAAASAIAQRMALGLGTAAVKNTGTTGTAIPTLDGANTWGAINTWSSIQIMGAAVRLAGFKVAAPPTGNTGDFSFCLDETGGDVPVFLSKDGNWRRVTDRAIIS